MQKKNAIEPFDINIDVERGFTSFGILYGISRRDEFMALEQFVALCQKQGAWISIPVQDFLALTTEGRKTLQSLISIGYIQLDEGSGRVRLTEGFIKRAYAFFDIKKARSPEEQAEVERQRVLKLVGSVISKDPGRHVDYLIIPRVHDLVTKVMRGVDLKDRLDEYGSWLDHGYVLIDLYTGIDRDEPLEDQLLTIAWLHPNKRTPKP